MNKVGVATVSRRDGPKSNKNTMEHLSSFSAFVLAAPLPSSSLDHSQLSSEASSPIDARRHYTDGRAGHAGVRDTMEPIHVLISAKVTAEQLARMRGLHPRLIIHGEPGGFAIMHASEVDYKGIDYPDERPDVDVESLVRQAEAIIATRIPNNLLDRAQRLRWLQFTSAGVDHLWKPSLDPGSVIVTSAKSIHGIPISEFVMGCMLFFAKGMARMQKQQRERVYKKFLIEELFGKTVALIGVGELGGAVARRSKAFGMSTVGVRRRPGRDGVDPAIDDVVEMDAMTEALGRADYVVSSLPLTDRTRGVLDEHFFTRMKPSAIFVNVGRGKTVREAALVRALEEKWIAGAGLDVYEQEPLPADSRLWIMPNVLLSPHMCGDTSMYMERFTDILCDNLLRYAEGRPLRNVVDPQERY